MQAGATTIKLMADIADIQRKFAEVGKIANQTAGVVGRAFDSLGFKIGAALSVGGLAAWVKSAINAADEMSKLAQKAGVAVKDVAGLQLAFRQSGVAAEQMVPIMAKLGVAVANGNEALKAMGIASRNADGSLKSTRQVLGDVATAFAGYQDGAAKTALAVKLFGEEGAKLMPLLNGGAEALDQFDAMALKLGLTLDEGTAKQAERFNDTLDLMGQGMAGVGRQVAADLLPTLSGLADQFFTSMSEGDRLRQVSQFLGNVLKGLYVVALGVVEVFNSVGKTLGGVAAIVVNVLQGNFTMAGDIARQLKEDLTGGWRETLAQMEQAWNATGSASFEAMATANAQLRAQAPLIEDNKKALKEKEEAEKQALRATIEAAKYANEQWDEEFKRIEEQRNATEKRIRDGREMLEQIEFETRLLGMNTTEREVAVAMRELERNGIVEGTEAYKAYAQAIRDAIANRESIKAAQELRRKELDEWQKHWDQVSESFVDALMQGGKSVAEYLKSLFRTLILRPILAPIGGAFASVFGGPASAADLVGGGATGSTFNIMSAAKSAYDAISTGFASLGNSVAFAADSMGAWLVNNTSGVLNQMGGSLMQSAGSLGTAASYLGGAAAGLALGQVISGGYSAIGKSGNTATVIGTAIGSIFGPLGSVVGGALGGLFNRAFGRKAPKTTGSGITGTFGVDGANVQQYQEWFSKGGWFRSDKRGVNYSAISSELDQFLDGSLRQIADATRVYASVLGMNADAVNGFSQSIRISLMGLSAEQQQEAITKALTDFRDALAAMYVQPFVRAGESAGEAMARLGDSLLTVNQVFDTLNQTLLGSSLVGGSAASSLLDAFGGPDAFAQTTSAYYRAFYTEAERTATATRQLTEVLASMGMELPETRAEFRALVESQNLYTESGRQNYAALIRLSAVFDEITPKVDTLAGQLGQMVNGLMSESLSAVDKQIAASQEAANSARTTARAYYSAAESLRAAAYSLFGQTLNSTQSVDYLRTQFQALNTQARTGDLDAMNSVGSAGAAFVDAYRQTAATRSDFIKQTILVQSQLEQTAAVADAMAVTADYQAMLYDINTAMLEVLRTSLQAEDVSVELLRGQLDALGNLSTMIEASQKLSDDQVLELQNIAGNTDDQVTLTDLVARATGGNELLSQAILDQLKVPDASAQFVSGTIVAGNKFLGDKIAELTTAITGVQQAQAERERQDALLKLQSQLMQAKATFDSQVYSLLYEQARQQISQWGYMSWGTTHYTDPNAYARDAFTNRTADWYSRLNSFVNLPNWTMMGVSGSMIGTADNDILGLRQQIISMGGVPQFAAGGMHAGGLRLVGEHGPELEATGPSRIYNANQTMAMLGGGGAVADEIRALREEVALLRYEARATAVNTAKTTRMLDDVTQGGTTIRTTEVAA